MHRTLKLLQATHGGYVVLNDVGQVDSFEPYVIYAGTLKKCLQYMKEMMRQYELSNPIKRD